MNKMNPEIKARWVAALRSGDYAQTRNALHDSEGYCCLGVLCDLYAKESGRRFSELSEERDRIDDQIPDPALPGARVQIWSGLDIDWKVSIGSDRYTLYDHNDSGRTFAQLAKAIEEQL